MSTSTPLPPRDLTVTETCALLSCTAPTVYKMLSRGDLDGYVVGRRGRRITFDSVERLRHSGRPAAARRGR